jgi:hypothetical protein
VVPRLAGVEGEDAEDGVCSLIEAHISTRYIFKICLSTNIFRLTLFAQRKSLV